ncbi:MAG: hypothetical protein R2867_13820 [Caldilineaceae bacterium]
MTGHVAAVGDLAFASDDSTLVSGSFDQSIRLWDVHKSQAIRVHLGYRNNIKTLALSPNERLLVNGNIDCSLSLWTLYADAQGTPVTRHLFRILLKTLFKLTTATMVWCTALHFIHIRLCWPVPAKME